MTWSDQIDADRGDFAELRHEMQIGITRLEARIDQRAAALETLIEKRSADLMTWSFLFWVGAVGAIAALAGVLG